MIVEDPDITHFGGAPPEDDAPLGIDPDAMEALELSPHGLEAIPRRRSKVPQLPGGVKHVKLLECRPKNLGRIAANPASVPIVEEILRRLVAKRDNHASFLPEPLFCFPGIHARSLGRPLAVNGSATHRRRQPPGAVAWFTAS